MIDAFLQFVRLAVIVLVVVVALVLSLTLGIFGADALFGPKAADFSNVTYPGDDGTTLVAYFQQPPATESFPAVILAPGRRGLNADVLRLTQWLVENGYGVLVPDLYRGKSAAALPREIFLSLTEPRDRMVADLDSAYHYLINQPGVNPERIGLIGLGPGGNAGLRYATEQSQIKVAVDAYGKGLTDPDALHRLGGPLLAIFGAQDPFISAEEIDQFEAALKTADADYTLIVRPDLGGDFLRLPDVALEGRPAYEVWHAIAVFLDATLQS